MWINRPTFPFWSLTNLKWSNLLGYFLTAACIRFGKIPVVVMLFKLQLEFSLHFFIYCSLNTREWSHKEGNTYFKTQYFLGARLFFLQKLISGLQIFHKRRLKKEHFCLPLNNRRIWDKVKSECVIVHLIVWTVHQWLSIWSNPLAH